MAIGCFKVYQEPSDLKDIHFEQIVLEAGATIPDDQLEIRDEADKALTVLRGLYEKDEVQFARYFKHLLSIAQLALVGPQANPQLAKRALVTLKAEIVVREGGKIKNEYMNALGQN